MSRRTALSRISPTASEQWGMVTAGQARRLEVSRVDLNRLIADGILEHVPDAARVYRLTGVPEDPDMDPLRAAWLQLGGGKSWEERTGRPDAVVSHRSAAHARGLGDLFPRMHEFYVPTRLRPRRDDLRLRVRPHLNTEAWSVWAGLPVCTVETIVSDLLHEHEDESAIAQIVRDARGDGLLSDSQLRRAANGHAHNYGHLSTQHLMAALTGEVQE
jgi:hypothetical protein